MIRALVILACLVCTTLPARAQSPVERAFDGAVAAFEAALPRLDEASFGVDLAAYRDALSFRRFASTHWGGTVTLTVTQRQKAEGSCSRYAAFVLIPPEKGTVSMIICPEFSAEGTDALRRLTILHEMVHVVAGPDECRAMAFAARVEQLALGQHTPVDRYWQANGCAGSGFSLP